jgi:glycosyltransferase involved in cell wall biosynthesis
MRTLVITMLDVEQEPNQRIHHVIRMLEHTAEEIVVATKVRTHGRSLLALARDSLRFCVRSTNAGRVTTLAIHPPLNYAQALAAGLVQGRLGAQPSRLRRWFAHTLSLLGMARDLVLVPAFVFVLLTRTRGAFDLCVAQGPWEAAVGWCLRRLGRVDRLLYDDIDFVAGGQIQPLRQAYVAALERTLIASADVAVSSGWRLARLRESSTGRRVHAIPNGVDPERFRMALRRAPHPAALIYSGNVAHYSGVDLAIAALPRVLASIPELRLRVVGGGDPPYLWALHQLAVRLGVQAAVEFCGPLPNAALPGLFAVSDIGLATSRPIALREYAFPLKVLEYMAAGLVVVGTAGSETEDLLARCGCGRAIAFEPTALADAIVEILGDSGERARNARAGTCAAEQFSWVHAMQSMRALATETSPAALRQARPQ